jgi:hypothetical protein
LRTCAAKAASTTVLVTGVISHDRPAGRTGGVSRDARRDLLVIARLEAGGTEPTLATLDRVARALGLELTIGFQRVA